jgi:hypothetical protein
MAYGVSTIMSTDGRTRAGFQMPEWQVYRRCVTAGARKGSGHGPMLAQTLHFLKRRRATKLRPSSCVGRTPRSSFNKRGQPLA